MTPLTANDTSTHHASRQDNKKLISVVCPVFNEEQAVPIFYQRLRDAICGLKDQYEFEIVFTDNCSTDTTRETIATIREKDREIQLISLSRNFGYQASLQAGLTYAAGAAIIIIDVDCEDPPEMIPEFIRKWESGFDVVYGIRRNRPDIWPLKIARSLFYRVLHAVADMDIVLYMAEFSLLSSHVRDATLNAANSFPFLRAEIGYAGFERCGLNYARAPRVAGTSHYNVLRMIKFAGAGILTASTFALRMPLYILPFLILVNAALLWWGANGSDVPFHSLVALDLLYLITLATILGLYVARVYKNGIGRPNFHINLKRSLMTRGFPKYPSPADRGSAV